MVDCYVGDDFSGLYGHVGGQDPVFVRYQTGYVITIEDFPLLWVPEIQTEIALLAMYAEYIALSQSVQVLLVFKVWIKDVMKALELNPNNLVFISKSIVFEGNNGALTLASNPRLTLRSKHIPVTYIWFQQQVRNEFVLQKSHTEIQKADIFTRGLQNEASL